MFSNISDKMIFIFYPFKEADSQFRYIALELCWATLTDYVEHESIRENCSLNQISILEQATTGLSHLHDLKIGSINVLTRLKSGKRSVFVETYFFSFQCIATSNRIMFCCRNRICRVRFGC